MHDHEDGHQHTAPQRREPKPESIIRNLNFEISRLHEELTQVKDNRVWIFALVDDLTAELAEKDSLILELKSRLMKHEPESFDDPEHSHDGHTHPELELDHVEVPEDPSSD